MHMPYTCHAHAIKIPCAWHEKQCLNFPHAKPVKNCPGPQRSICAGAPGRRGYWNPKPGDVIVFTDNGTTRTHTGMVYAVDGTYVYTYEGNSSNMCRKRSYLLTSTYIYGYIRPAYADASGEDATTTPVTAEIVLAPLGRKAGQ